MEIQKIGEFGLIDRLTKDIKPQNTSTKYGVGDDCAVLHYPDSEVLVTTDMLMEGVHFDLTYIDLQHLGWKAAMVNISDIFAMNGTPRQLTVSLALSKRFSVEDIELFYDGLRMACDKWNVDIVGGDTTSSYTGLAISITCIGEARKEDIVYRNGARETDLAKPARKTSSIATAPARPTSSASAATSVPPTWACNSWNARKPSIMLNMMSCKRKLQRRKPMATAKNSQLSTLNSQL